MYKHTFLIWGLLVMALMVLPGCDTSNAEALQAPPPPDVSVANVISRNVAQWDEFTGRIEAVETVEIRPQVTGYLERVSYEEGKEVSKGKVLFVIDQRPYRAELERAEAELERARTQAELARSEVVRAHKLREARAISQEEFDQRTAASEQGEAAIRAAEANVEMARLNLEFTEVRSPIDGRAGRAMITEGNLVNGHPGASLLTKVVSLDPVYVYFDGDEQTYLRYADLDRRGERSSSRDKRNPVRVGLANEQGFPHTGYVDFVDNQLDPDTGTIRTRAVLDNSNRHFTPGLFARVQLLGSDQFQAQLVDDKAILTDQDRRYVYVLGPENRALRKNVTLGRSVDGLRIVSSGLEPDDLVIVHGVQKIFFPGMPVNPREVTMGDPPGDPGHVVAQSTNTVKSAEELKEPGS